jgi:hypothetical protein
MNHAIPNLQILIHKVDGATTTFTLNDACGRQAMPNHANMSVAL